MKEMVKICMITYVAPNVEIPFEGIYNGAITNDDGHGWAVASSKYGLQVGKSMKFEEALKDFAVARVSHGDDSIGLFHSRFATHGTVDEYNVHPFYVKDHETVLAHNGILPSKWQPGATDARSDTRVFVDEVMPEFMTPAGIPSRRGAKRLGKLIGTGNKFVILSVESGAPKVRIINAFMGEHSNGVWYSNTGYLPWRSRFGSYGYGGYGSYRSEPRAITARSCETKEVEFGESPSTVYFEGEYYLDSPCEFCLRHGFVNADTMICESCDTCNDCYADAGHCECNVGSRIDSETSMFAEVQEHLAQESKVGSPWPPYGGVDEMAGAWPMD
jgi:hypothetical protein